MKTKTTLAMIASLVAGLAGCTMITDFSGGDAGADGGDLYSLDDNLTEAVQVQLSANYTGEITLQFVEPLPEAESDDALLALITDGTVDLVVTNDETGVNFNLAADGQYSEDISVAGDYNLELGTSRDIIIVHFYNEVSGSSLHADGDYSATIDVLQNDYFLMESFNREVQVFEN